MRKIRPGRRTLGGQGVPECGCGGLGGARAGVTPPPPPPASRIANQTLTFFFSHLQAQGKSVTHCAGAAPECAALRATLFHCKRSSVDARSRIQGNKLDR